MKLSKKEPTQLEFNDWLEAEGHLKAKLISNKCLCGALLDKKKVLGYDHSRSCAHYEEKPLEVDDNNKNKKQKGIAKND